MVNKTSRFDNAIENRSCIFNRKGHKWSLLGAKFEQGTVVHCMFCYIESMKYYPSGERGAKSLYYPHGTWFKVMKQVGKKTEENEEEIENE